ncbi:MAG: rod shape-determining protein MreD [Rhodospirillales bacterium]|nr:rod shape-determining protein MreD [Rhodospirillales bacterium]|tara:strand:+ start:977 stop:1492 length:516 start_codon:yes stop_codon:yes gene_type:complete
MTTLLSNRLDMFARRCFPVLAGIFFVLISTVPYYIPGFGPVVPNVVLIAVFFWVIHHAEFVPTATVFFIGLLLDILSGAPPGINAATLVLVRTLLVMQSKVFRGKSFLLLWWGFSLVAFLVGLVIWALSAFYHMILLNPLPIIFQMLMTITIFPFFSWVFAKLHQKFLPID